jgi:tRNA threonylcarbamoyl adenosine modification protein YeaZ
MKILALEFSSPERSVAVVQRSGAGQIGAEVVERSGRETRALGMVEEALRLAQLEREQIECLAIGLGPGSYNGIRAAIALAQGWQLARDIKLLGISSVECLASQAYAEGLTGRVSLVIDAQRKEFYLAAYEIGPRESLQIAPLRLASLTEVKALEQAGASLAGPEVAKWFPGGRVLFPRAAALGQQALKRLDFVPGEKLEPIYLRETAFVKAAPPTVVEKKP